MLRVEANRLALLLCYDPHHYTLISFDILGNIFIFTPLPMKKILAFILFALYFTSSSGATFHIHYCMNELVGLSLTSADESNGICAYCGMEKGKLLKHTGKPVKDCCNEHKLTLKTDKNHRSGFSAMDCNSFQIELISPIQSTDTFFNVYSSPTVHDYSESPPPLSQSRIYIFHNNFRI